LFYFIVNFAPISKKTMPYSKIVALGHHVPETVITNQYLSTVMDTSDAWITEYDRMRGEAQRLLGGRLERAVSLVAGGLDPLTVDEEPGAVQVGVLLGGSGHGYPSPRAASRAAGSEAADAL